MNEAIAEFVLTDHNRKHFKPQDYTDAKLLVVVYVESEDYFALKLVKSALYRLGVQYQLLVYTAPDVQTYVRAQMDTWQCGSHRATKIPPEKFLCLRSFWDAVDGFEHVLIMPRPAFVYKNPLEFGSHFCSESGGPALIPVTEALKVFESGEPENFHKALATPTNVLLDGTCGLPLSATSASVNRSVGSLRR